MANYPRHWNVHHDLPVGVGFDPRLGLPYYMSRYPVSISYEPTEILHENLSHIHLPPGMGFVPGIAGPPPGPISFDEDGFMYLYDLPSFPASHTARAWRQRERYRRRQQREAARKDDAASQTDSESNTDSDATVVPGNNLANWPYGWSWGSWQHVPFQQLQEVTAFIDSPDRESFGDVFNKALWDGPRFPGDDLMTCVRELYAAWERHQSATKAAEQKRARTGEAGPSATHNETSSAETSPSVASVTSAESEAGTEVKSNDGLSTPE
ncbi:uncharacterized protein CLAFUR5_04731 [Fulvia fulva]|uniref:Uncharacterized protein n=1 Tax=Passalora fulva TaxID=5499 RepID=A0A9Q8P8C0_PASFU|nr:uncharacterized protein CLAFUR5_04731 [Fulvia fulva]UJO16978.1 hypothetical protein CLAFUR5_04731 [Fulvia fulva]